MATVRITTVNGTENTFKLVLSAEGSPINHTTILAAELRTSRGLTIADSDVDATDWDFTNTGYITVKLGLTEAVVGKHNCVLIIRDADHSIGLAWDGTKIDLTVQP